jgi:hypothetical protein
MRRVTARAASRPGAMRRRASRRRPLSRIERTLLADDLGLASLFGIFTWLTRDDPMPLTERVTARPWRRLRPALAVAIGLAAVAGAVMLGVLLPGPPACPARAAAVSARIQPSRTGRPAFCAVPAGPAARLPPAVGR